MTRAQWLIVAFIGVVAVIAYDRSTKIAKYLGISGAHRSVTIEKNTPINNHCVVNCGRASVSYNAQAQDS